MKGIIRANDKDLCTGMFTTAQLIISKKWVSQHSFIIKVTGQNVTSNSRDFNNTFLAMNRKETVCAE